MSDSFVRPIDDEVARQRRKRETRLLERHLAEFPALTLADVVADVLAACDQSPEVLDVRNYLALEGYGSQTIEEVVGYLHREYRTEPPMASQHPSR